MDERVRLHTKSPIFFVFCFRIYSRSHFIFLVFIIVAPSRSHPCTTAHAVRIQLHVTIQRFSFRPLFCFLYIVWLKVSLLGHLALHALATGCRRTAVAATATAGAIKIEFKCECECVFHIKLFMRVWYEILLAIVRRWLCSAVFGSWKKMRLLVMQQWMRIWIMHRHGRSSHMLLLLMLFSLTDFPQNPLLHFLANDMKWKIWNEK